MAQDIQKLHTQLDLFMKIILSKDEYKDKQVASIYRNGIFLAKTKSVTSLTVLHYLLKILVPHKLTKVLWPLYDNKMEAEFRRIALQILNEIFKNKSHVQKINMSILITGYGVKLVHTLVNLASEILQRDLRANENTSLRLGQLVKKCQSVKTGEEAGVKKMVEAVERVEILKQPDLMVAMEQAQDRAIQLISDIKQSENLTTKVEEEAANFVNRKSLHPTILNDESKMQDFQNETEKQSSHLNNMMNKVQALLGKTVPCDDLSVTSVQQLSGGDSTMDLMSVVKKAHEFRNSNPMLTIFGTAGSENQECIGLTQQVKKLVLDLDIQITKEIAQCETELSEKRAKYQQVTEELKQRIDWKPSLPQPKLAICDPDWLNSWDCLIRGETPATATQDLGTNMFEDFSKRVKNFCDEHNKKEIEKFESNRKKLSVIDILFSDIEDKKFSPPCSQNVTLPSNMVTTIASPASSGSPLACSSRIMSSLASTPLRKQPESPGTPPVKKQVDSLLYNLLCSKKQDGSSCAARNSLTDMQGFNFSFGSGTGPYNVPSNLSETTCSSTSFLYNSVLDESFSSPTLPSSPLAVPTPTIKKLRPSLLATIEKYKKLKAMQSQDLPTTPQHQQSPPLL